jgi:hypothetical protein
VSTVAIAVTNAINSARPFARYDLLRIARLLPSKQRASPFDQRSIYRTTFEKALAQTLGARCEPVNEFHAGS